MGDGRGALCLTTTTTRSAIFALVIIIIIIVAGIGGGGCEAVEPETGDIRLNCVDADSDPAHDVSFKNDIRPLIQNAVVGTKGCKLCHFPNTGTQEGLEATGLNLSTLGDLRRGGRNTPPNYIVVPGKPCSSAIVRKLEGTFGDARMPKDGPYWDATKIQIMVDWIFEGAKGDDAD